MSRNAPETSKDLVIGRDKPATVVSHSVSMDGPGSVKPVDAACLASLVPRFPLSVWSPRTSLASSDFHRHAN